MGLKRKLAEFMVVHDLVPSKTRWERSASGVGRMFNDVFQLLDDGDRAKLTKMMYSWGLEDAERAAEALGVNRDLHGCAVALMSMHRIFGIESHIAREDRGELAIHATKCLWKDKEGWTYQTCASIDAYEKGLLKGLNSDIKSVCTKRRSKGDEVCEMILSK